MLGLMQDQPLLISGILEHARKWSPRQEVISLAMEGGVHRQSFLQTAERSSQLARALTDRGIKPGDRVGIIGLNTNRHLELWYGISGMGAIAHSINPRLSPDQIKYVIEDAGDSLLFVDLPFLKLVEALKDNLPTIASYVVMTDEAHMPDGLAFEAISYEALIKDHPTRFDWPKFDENTANAICHTSGTTGAPKGVRYSHRSNVLHALAASARDVLGIGATDTVLPMVPMFHANGWGMPYACLAYGAGLVLPGGRLDGASLYDVMQAEDVTLSLGVPTICRALLDEIDKRGTPPSALRKMAIAGSAAPPEMIRRFADYGIRVIHAWGMTETSPIGTAWAVTHETAQLPETEQTALKSLQGRPVFGVDIRIVDTDGNALPHDGETSGALQVRGGWVVQRYHNGARDAVDADGWFDTGDVASIDDHGFMRLTDRAKDLIKSGGEWISSVDLESAAESHPDIAIAAAIGVPHPKWDERPLLLVVAADQARPDTDDVKAFLAKRLTRMSVPDDMVVVDALPVGATGKIQKAKLRDQYAGHYTQMAQS